jgi:hypothetical protein
VLLLHRVPESHREPRRSIAEVPRYSQHPSGPKATTASIASNGLPDGQKRADRAAKYSAGLVFSGDGRWLVIALDAGTRTRLLAWRSGVLNPYETTAIPGLVREPPTLVVAA